MKDLVDALQKDIVTVGVDPLINKYKKHYKKIVSLGFIITLFGASTLIVLGLLISNYLSILLFENEEFSFLITLNFLSR